MTTRNRIDAEFVKTAALPAAGELTWVAFDLGQVDADALEGVVVELEVPATTTLVATKKLTFGLDTTADNESYGENDAFADQTAKPILSGKTDGGSIGATYRWRLPLGCQRWLLVGCEAAFGAGDNTGTSYTVRLLT